MRKAIPLLLLVGLLLAGIYRVLDRRLDRGDVHPPYSSLRPDPVGSEALFEALRSLQGLQVERNYDRLSELEAGAGTTLLIVGAPPSQVEPHPILRTLAQRGARVVVALAPVTRDWAWVGEDDGEREEADEDPADGDEKEMGGDPTVEADGEAGEGTEGRGLEDASDPDPEPEDEPAQLAGHYRSLPSYSKRSEIRPALVERVGGSSRLPDRLDWHSGVVLEIAHPGWDAIYARDDDPVVVERRLGAGSVVILSDSYVLSNEGLKADPSGELLAWLLGTTDRVVFDETHLGTARSVGIMVLARRYRLLGFFAGIGLVAALYLWRALVPLRTRRTGPVGVVDPAGKDDLSGLAHLLDRALPGTALSRACVEAWTRSMGSSEPELVREVRNTATGAKSSVETYSRIERLLASRSTSRGRRAR